MHGDAVDASDYRRAFIFMLICTGSSSDKSPALELSRDSEDKFGSARRPENDVQSDESIRCTIKAMLQVTCRIT